jgi:hypothetical protein
MRLTPGRVLFAFLFFTSFIDGIYSIRQTGSPWLNDELSRIVFVWLIWWWLKEDSRRSGIMWVLDLGMFLLMGWIFILPYHLFKTRGFKGFIPILFFMAVYLAGIASAAILSGVLGW